MIRNLIAAALVLTFCFTGCSSAPPPKTEDPVEIEKIRQKEIENSHREIHGTPPPPATGAPAKAS
jgi:hypothetical protein